MTINLRNVPEELVRRAKAHAASQGLTLKAFVLGAINQALPFKMKMRYPRERKSNKG